MTPTTFAAPNPIQPAPLEAVWFVVSAVVWIALIVAVVLAANWLLNRWAGKPIRWPRRWARRSTA